jgi:hypothetical protein
MDFPISIQAKDIPIAIYIGQSIGICMQADDNCIDDPSFPLPVSAITD